MAVYRVATRVYLYIARFVLNVEGHLRTLHLAYTYILRGCYKKKRQEKKCCTSHIPIYLYIAR